MDGEDLAAAIGHVLVAFDKAFEQQRALGQRDLLTHDDLSRREFLGACERRLERGDLLLAEHGLLMGAQKQIDQHGNNSGTYGNGIRFFPMARTRKRTTIEPEDRPLDAVAEQGVVLVDGAGGVAITLTAQAASRSATAMARAANTADEQGTPPPAKQR
jgi:hypothetical protein